jgi:hypothetical protein
MHGLMTQKREVRIMRLFITAVAALAMTGLHADEIALKNGQKISGNVQGLKEGQLDVGVFAGYLGGFPSYQSKKLRFSNIRSIKFDGRDDFFSIVKKDDDLVFAEALDLAKGKLTVKGHDPIPASSIKAIVQSRPDEQERN